MRPEDTIQGSTRRLRPSLSLRTVLGFSFGALALLLALVLSVIVGRLASQQLRADIARQFEAMAFDMRNMLDRSMHERTADIRFAATGPLMSHPAAPPEARRRRLTQLKAEFRDHAWIGFVDPAGKVIAASDGLLEGADVSARPWFQGGLKGPYVGDVHEAVLLAKHVPTRSGEPARFVDVVAPVYAPDGALLGLLGSHVNWAWAERTRDELLAASPHSQADILVVSQSGAILLGSAREGGTFPIPQSLLASASGQVAASAAEGDQLIAVSRSQGYGSFPGLGWTIVVKQDADEALQPVRDLQRQVLLWGSVIGLLFILLGLFAAEQIARPLRKIAGVADRLREGDDTALRSPRSFAFAELGLLFRSLTDLFRSLRSKETELQEANRRLTRSLNQMHTLVQSAPLPIIAYDLQGQITIWNPAAEQTFGFAAEEALGHQPPHVPPERLSHYLSALEGVLKGQGLKGEDRRLRRKDGTEIEANIWGSPLQDETGQIIGAITIIKDVTQERATEAQLRQAQKMEAVGQLTGGIAHDFNNLLGVILGNAELLAEDLEHDPALRQASELIMETAERGARLTQQLLAFARKQDLASEPLDISEVITSLVTLLSRSLGEQVEIRAKLEPDLPKALVDHAQLEAALVNLSVNARDAMPKGGQLLLETKAVQVDGEEFGGRLAPGTYIRIAVTDTGTGMPPEVAARVFEPFFTTKEVGKGTGLGLSMVYGFAKQSGGHVEVYSEPGIGTTISLYVPVAEGQETRAEQAGAEAVPLASSETILLVEDEPAFRHFLTSTLQKLGYEVVECESGPLALGELEKGFRPDLLLTDVILPGGMNGREVAQQVSERHPNVPVLFMSGYPDTVLADRGTLSPNVQLLRKPFRKAQLAQAVHAALKVRSE